jgi:hypothetical protein
VFKDAYMKKYNYKNVKKVTDKISIKDPDNRGA